MDYLLQIDKYIFNRINAGWANPVFDYIMPLITHAGDADIIWIFILLAGFAWILKKGLHGDYSFNWKNGTGICLRQFFFTFLFFALTYAINAVVINSLKFIFNRQRPFEIIDAIVRVSMETQTRLADSGSFPSGHACNALLLAAVFSFIFRGKGFIFYILAALVALSRVYLGVHFPLDILTGGLLGWAITRLMLSSERLKRRFAMDKTDAGR